MGVIIVTGSVSSGKTTLAKRLSKKLDYKYIDVNKLIEQDKISSGYDKKMKCKIIDIKKLNKALIKLINKNKKPLKNKTNKKLSQLIKKNKKIIKGIVIDSHLSHYLPNRYVDLCIVTKCDIKELNKRLKKRKYGRDKIKENIECEIFDICLNEAKEQRHKLLIIDTTKGINIGDISKRVKRIIK